ncbi:Zinc metalloproteinase nas-13 [Dirofilaria immitis]
MQLSSTMRFLIIAISTCIGFVSGDACYDRWRDCRKVVLNGECRRYPSYAKQCSDKWENCTKILRHGQCSHYTESCAFTCGKCNSPRVGQNDCKDKWKDCRKVALNGECHRHPVYARIYCAYTCEKCNPTKNEPKK